MAIRWSAGLIAWLSIVALLLANKVGSQSSSSVPEINSAVRHAWLLLHNPEQESGQAVPAS